MADTAKPSPTLEYASQQTITEAVKSLRRQMGANTAARFVVPVDPAHEPIVVYVADSPTARLIMGAAWETAENWAEKETRKNAEANR